MGRFLDTILQAQFDASVDLNFIKKLYDFLKPEELKEEFTKRAEPLNKTRAVKANFDKFYVNAIAHYLTNVYGLDNKISKTFVHPSGSTVNVKSVSKYLKSLKYNRFSQNIIRKLEKYDGGYIATFQSGLQRDLGIKELLRFISKSHLVGERTVFLTDYNDNYASTTPVTQLVSFADKLTTSVGAEVSLSQSEKILTLTQTNQDDWVLVQSGNLNGSTILFNGVEKVATFQLLTDQWFNKYGLTGCLNFYNPKFPNTIIEVVAGVCEDSIIIVNSMGTIDSILVTGAFADALDINFSIIDISRVDIDNAGNDCLDVGGGSYQVGITVLINYDDKGVSVGEVSTLFAKGVELSSIDIGVSSKDLSKVEILDAQFKDVAVCIEVIQKKQEFGGAWLQVSNLECDGIIEVDKHSEFKKSLQ